MLLRTQQNELAARILREGFNPHDFAPFRNRNTDDGSPVTRLTHTPSGFHIDFVDDQGVEFSPGAGRLTDYLAGRDFGLQFVGFCNWLDNLKRETEAPDLWAEPRSQKDLVALSRSDSSDNSPFTEIERRRVEKGIEELRHYLLESAAIELDRHEIISAKLDEAWDASNRMGRKDWTTYALGTVTNIVLSAAMNPAQTAALFRLFVDAFGWAAFGQPLLPP